MVASVSPATLLALPVPESLLLAQALEPIPPDSCGCNR
jgi:hypothetical protein